MSVKVTSNGRRSYPELQEAFERVHLVYNFNQETGQARATALLVQDGIVHVGVAKFSNRTFQFSRSKGRSMALGRAEHAANVFHGVETQRQSKEKRREELSYSIFSTEESTVDDILTQFLGARKES